MNLNETEPGKLHITWGAGGEGDFSAHLPKTSQTQSKKELFVGLCN